MASRSKPISMLQEFLDSLEDPRDMIPPNQAQDPILSSATVVEENRRALFLYPDLTRYPLTFINDTLPVPTLSSNIKADQSLKDILAMMKDDDSDAELSSATAFRKTHGMTVHPLYCNPDRYLLTASNHASSDRPSASGHQAKQPEDSHTKTEDHDSDDEYDSFNEAVRYLKQREEPQIQHPLNAPQGGLYHPTPSIDQCSMFAQQSGSSTSGTVHERGSPTSFLMPDQYVHSQETDDLNRGFDPLPTRPPESKAIARKVRPMPHIDLFSMPGNMKSAQESHSRPVPSRVRNDRDTYYASTTRADGSHGLSKVAMPSVNLESEVQEFASLAPSSPNALVLPRVDDIDEQYNKLIEQFNYRLADSLPKEEATSDDFHETMDEFKNRLIHLLGQMMFVSGEQAEPSPETTWMIEEIVREQVLEMLKEASALANRRGSKSISIVDLIFQIRHNPAKVSRLKTFLSWKDVRKNVKDSDDKAGADADALDLEEGALPGANPAAPQKTSTNRKAKLILPWEVQSFYNETVPEREDEEDEEEEEQNEATLARLASADERTKNMTREEYVYWSDCRQASFTFRKGKRFREWAGFGTIIDSKPNDDVVDILGFLTFEIVQTLTEEALKVKAAEDVANKKASGLRGDIEANKRRKREGCTLFEMVEEDKTPVEPKHVREAFRRLQIVPKKYTFMRQGYAGVRTPLRMI